MNIDEIIARCGVYLQAVCSEHPYDTPFTYTVGRHQRGQPELIETRPRRVVRRHIAGYLRVMDDQMGRLPSAFVRATPQPHPAGTRP